VLCVISDWMEMVWTC